MAKYKTNFDHKPHKWKLFYVSVFFILVIVFFGHFSRYIIDFLDSVDKVTDNQSVAEFSQSVSEIHGKWLESKNAITTLQLIDSLDLKSKGELSFIVNEVGWPINLSQNGKTQTTKQVDCKALWLNMQSQQVLKTLRIDAMFDKKNNVTGCIYFRGENRLFEYHLNNGMVVSAITH
jgi:hypothetical protein